MAITPESNYYNLFDSTKKYYEIRALAGLVEQSREDNEIQAILKNIIKDFGNTLYKNGSLVSGGAFSRGTTNVNQLTMQETKIWFNGIVHDVPSRVLTLTGGTDNIGIKITESIVTYSTDPQLKDPAVGYANYGQPGANRLKIEATWELNDAQAIPFYTFNNFTQQTQPKVGDIDVVTTTLARRTYDESGNYVVAGFDLKVSNLNDSQVQLTAGNFRDASYSGSKAYVQGQEIVKLVADTLPVDRALDTRSVADERKYYAPADPFSPTATEMRFELDSQPGARVTRVTATFDVIRTVTNHNFNGYDEITQVGETLIDIIRVFKGGTVSSPSTTYAKSNNGAAGPGDWYRSSNGLRWDVSGSSSEPTAGDTYTVYALVRKQVEIAPVSAGNSGQAGKVHLYSSGTSTFLDVSNLNPKPYAYNQATSTIVSGGSDLDVDYDFYLSRIDVVYISPSGVVGAVKGSPDVRPTAPYAPGGVLALGQIYLTAGADASKAQLTQYDVKRLTMLDLRKLLNRLERAEYNQAIKDLDDDGVKRAGNSITTLRGILTESFTYTANDIVTDGENGISKLKFVRSLTTEKMINVRNRELQLPEYEDSRQISVSSSGTTGDMNSSDAVTIARKTSPLYEVVNYSAATSNMQINQFDVFRGYATIDIDPDSIVGRLTDQTTINSIDATNAEGVVNTFMTDRTTFLNQANAALVNQTGFVGGVASQESTKIRNYMPTEWVWMVGQNFTPGSAIDIKVDGRPAKLALSTAASVLSVRPIPLSFPTVAPASTITGTPSGDEYPSTSFVQANSNGMFLTAVKIPEGIPSGTIQMIAESTDGRIAVAEFTNDASITFVEQTPFLLLKNLDSVIKPLPPKFPANDAVVVRNNSNNTVVTDIVGATTLKFTVKWDKAGGVPDDIVVTLSPMTSVIQTGSTVVGQMRKTRSQLSNAELIAGTVEFVTSIPVTNAVDYAVVLSNAGGSAPAFNGTITLNSVAPTVSNPLIGSFNVSPAPNTTGSTTTTATWSGLVGTYSQLIIKNTVSTTNVPNQTPIVISNPQPSGSVPITVFNGSQTITAQAIGNLGSSVTRSTTLVVSSPPQVWWYDPLAQSFSVDKDTYVNDIDIFFQAKPSSTRPVKLQIRAMNNGMPTSTLIDNATATVQNSGVQVSANATTATNFKFARPVFLQGGVEYAVVLQTDDPGYRVFYSKLGENFVGTSTPQLYQSGPGVMFTSANDNSWTPLQDSDLKMIIRGINFESSSLVYFNTVSKANMVGFHFSPAGLLLPGSGSSTTSPCRIVWEYQLGGTGSWLPFEPNSYVYFAATASLVQIRATLQNNQGSALSPRLAKAGHALTVITRAVTGSYITKTATFSQAYRYVRMIAKQDLPAGSNVRWYVSDNTPFTSAATWNSGTTYASGAFVTYGGLTYVSLQGTNLNHTPDSSPSWWEYIATEGNVVWHEIPATGETKTLMSDGIFYEHERLLDLGTNSGRFQFRFRLDITVPSAAATVKTPKVRDVITITTT
jgi:hypothetical protein